MNASTTQTAATTTNSTSKKEITMNTMFSTQDMSITPTIHGEPQVGFSGRVYLPFTGMYYTRKTAGRVLSEHSLDFTLNETEKLIADIDFDEYDQIDESMRTYGAYVYTYETFLGSEVVFVMGPNIFKAFQSVEAYATWKSSVKAVVAK